MRIILLLLIFVVQPVGAQAAPDAILAAIAQAPKPPRAFTETVSSKWLKTPQVQTGFVKLEADGTLTKITREPEAMIVRISEDALSLTRADGQQRTVPATRSDVAALLIGLRGVLLGDVAALRTHYDLQASGELSDWSLTLEPLDAKLAKRLTRITVTGTGGNIDAVQMLEPDDDKRLLEFAPL
ncbi:hypothetical protein GYB61_03290 [bacterium]|nr:hypothetical protein [bacterium]